MKRKQPSKSLTWKMWWINLEKLHAKKNQDACTFTLGCCAISPNIIKLCQIPHFIREATQNKPISYHQMSAFWDSSWFIRSSVHILPCVAFHGFLKPQGIGRTFSKTRWALKFPGCFMTGSAFLDPDPSRINWGYCRNIPHVCQLSGWLS